MFISRNVERTRVHRTGEHAAGAIRELNNRLLKELAHQGTAGLVRPGFGRVCPRSGQPVDHRLGLRPVARQKTRAAGEGEWHRESYIRQGAEYYRAKRAPLPRVAHDVAKLWQRRGRAAQADLSLGDCPGGGEGRRLDRRLGIGVELTSEISDDPCTLLGDPVQVTRAIQNVIVNAVQASTEKKGSVSVKCERKEFYVDVRVQDTGIGMTSAQIPKIFEPCFTTKQNKSGTGLGLFITKKVVEDHNGWIRSTAPPTSARLSQSACRSEKWPRRPAAAFEPRQPNCRHSFAPCFDPAVPSYKNDVFS